MNCVGRLLTTDMPCYAEGGRLQSIWEVRPRTPLLSIRIVNTNNLRSIMTKKRLILPLVLTLSTLAACGGSGGQQIPPPADPDLVSVLEGRPNLKRFKEALEATGVASTLQSGGAYTILAPMDKAVTGPLDQATVRHHILPTRVTFSDMAGESTSYDTLNGDQVEIDATEQIAIGTGLMVESDIQAANGVIHVIDQVQTPAGGSETPTDQGATDQAPEAEPAVNPN